MTDEFGVSKTVLIGSNGGKEVDYNIYSERLSADLNGITFDEIVRLNAFLTDYIKKEQEHENK